MEDYLGISVSHVGDVNGDGFTDLIVAVHWDDGSGPDSGSARGLLGTDLGGHLVPTETTCSHDLDLNCFQDTADPLAVTGLLSVME